MSGAWSAILAEARDDHTLYLLGGLAVTVVLVRAAAREERRRLLGIVVMALFHVMLVPVAGIARAHGAPAYRDVHLASLIFAAMSAIGMAGTVLFAVLLPRLRLHTPRILRDVLGAVAVLTPQVLPLFGPNNPQVVPGSGAA